MITTLSSKEEIEAGSVKERSRIEELMPGTRVATRRSVIRGLVEELRPVKTDSIRWWD